MEIINVTNNSSQAEKVLEVIEKLTVGGQWSIESSAGCKLTAKEIFAEVAPLLQSREYDFDASLIECYGSGDTSVEVTIHEAGRQYDKVFGGYYSLMTTVGNIFVDILNDGCYLIKPADDGSYEASDVLKYITPLLDDEKCSYDVTYIADKQLAELRIY